MGVHFCVDEGEDGAFGTVSILPSGPRLGQSRWARVLHRIACVSLPSDSDSAHNDDEDGDDPLGDFRMDSEEMSALSGRLDNGADAYSRVLAPDDQSMSTWGFLTARDAYTSFHSDSQERVSALEGWCARVAEAVADTANQTQAMEDELQSMFAWDEDVYQ